MTRRRLTGLDTAFLSAEVRGNPLHVMGLLVLDPRTVPGGYDFERFRAFIADRLPVLAPLRRRLVEVPGGLARPYWIEDAEIDLEVHVRRAAVPSPGGPREIAAMAEEMMAVPLDRSRPLWEMRVVEGLEGGRIALLAKLSHAMMDGMAGIKLMASLFNVSPEILPAPQVAPPEPDEVPGTVGLLLETVPWLLRQPGRAIRATLVTASNAFSRLRSGDDEEAASVHVHRSWFNAPISPRRRVATVSLPLDELKAVGHAHAATVNDVILAVVAGALRRYLAPRGRLPAEPLVAGVPLALRADDEGAEDEEGNVVTSVPVSLATHLGDPVARLEAIRDAMAVQKRRRHRTVGGDLAAWADVPPPLLFSLMSHAYVDLDLEARIDPLVNLVVSSVPGPPEALFLAGARLDAIHPLGPIISGMGLNVTAIGCGDAIDFGLVACRELMPDLWDLADAIPEALRELGAPEAEAATSA
jgi:WS/DGAT/MGAT family acyltransferase